MSVLLETERLLLRPPRAADISHFVPLLGDFDVAKNLSRVPYPYTEDHACAFIVATNHAWRTRVEFTFSILRNCSATSRPLGRPGSTLDQGRDFPESSLPVWPKVR